MEPGIWQVSWFKMKFVFVGKENVSNKTVDVIWLILNLGSYKTQIFVLGIP